MSRLGIAVLGYAHGHVSVYSRLIAGYDDARLVACWDHDEERGRNAARTWNMDYSPHVEDVTGRGDVDAVIIGAETHRHADLVEAAAGAGKAILLQKPMALSLADCDRIIDAVDRSGVWFSLAFQMRHDPMNRKMKELIDAGAVGRVGIVRRRHCIPVLLSPSFGTGSTAWHLDPVANRGMFMDDASHATDWFLWYLGMATSVTAEIDNVLSTHAPDDTGVAIYRFAHGEVGILFNSSVVLAGENTTEIYGDRGVLIQNHDDGPSTAIKPPHPIGLKLFQQDKAEEGWQDLGFELPDSHGARIEGVPRPFIDALKHHRPPTVTAREGRQSTEMILGAYRSAQEGRRITFPLDE